MASQLQSNLIEIKSKLEIAGEYIQAISEHKDVIPYIEVQYIQNACPNNQEAWIPTDIKFNSSNTLEVKFQYSVNVENSDDRVFRFPERQYAFWMFGRYRNKFRLVYGTSQWGTTISLLTQDTNIHTLRASTSFYVDNTQYVSSMNLNFSDNMYFCNAKDCRLYYIKYSNSNGDLLYDLIPVIRKSDYKAGMYDKVSGNFYMPNIEDGFIAGPEVE